MASLERHGNGFRVRWRTGGRGSKSQVSATYATKTAANEAKRAIEARQDALSAKAGPVVSFAALVERWAAQVRAGQRHRDAQRRLMLRLGAAHGWQRAADIRPAQVQALGRYYHGKAVRSLLRFAELLDQPIDARACRTLPPTPRRRPAAPLLDDNQVAILIDAAEAWSAGNAALAHLVAHYGHRPQSLVGLPCSALAGDSLTIPVKGGDIHRHPLTAETVERLRTLAAGRPPDAPLFLSHLDEPWPTGNAFAGWWWHQIGSVHTSATPGVYHLKRYAISRMLSAGLDIATIASITGHRTPSILLRYARTNETRQRAALATLSALSCTPGAHHESA